MAGELEPPPLIPESPELIAERAAALRLSLLQRGVREMYVDLRIEDMMQDQRMPDGYRRLCAKLPGVLIASRAQLAVGGGRGLGKTAIGSALARRCMERGGYSFVTTISQFLDRIETLRGDARDRCRDKFERCDLLILDEVQERRTGGWRDWLEGEFIRLIDSRYANRRSTMLITNLLPEAFADNVGDSIQRRVFETGGFEQCDWPRIDEILRQNQN